MTTMTLQRIHFPSDSGLAGLYARLGDGNVIGGRLSVPANRSVSLDAFFSSFAVGRNGWPVHLGPMACELRVEGAAEVELMARDAQGRERVLSSAGAEEAVDSIMTLGFDTAEVVDERVFPRVHAGGAEVFVDGGRYVASGTPHPISLAIVICTYQREEALIRNVRRICADNALMAEDVIVIVADNGRTLHSDDMPSNVHLFPGPNLGGAGGFSRGMAEAMRLGATHIVLMDDDVVLDTEALYRCCRHFQVSPQGTALIGTLLGLDDPVVVQEAGAWISDSQSLLLVRPGNCGKDISKPEGLDELLTTAPPEYGGFWLFAFAVEHAVRSGLLLPLFIKADDIEFCLRLGDAGVLMQLQCGFGVQHANFTDEFSIIKRCYWVRNMMIVETLHGNRTTRAACQDLLRWVTTEMKRMRPAHLAALAIGMEAYMHGPDALTAEGDESLLLRLASADRTLTEFRTGPMKHATGLVWAMAALMKLAKLGMRFSGLRRQWLSHKNELASAASWEKRFRET